MHKQQDNFVCSKLLGLVSDFVDDTFVDFIVGGQFLGNKSNSKSLDNDLAVAVEDDSNWARTVTRLPTVDRLVAIGDIHGDLQKARQALMATQVMDENDQWRGGKTTVVQVGDLLGQGDEELKVIYLLEKLKQQSEKSSGKLVILNGNH